MKKILLTVGWRNVFLHFTRQTTTASNNVSTTIQYTVHIYEARSKPYYLLLMTSTDTFDNLSTIWLSQYY